LIGTNNINVFTRKNYVVLLPAQENYILSLFWYIEGLDKAI